MTKAEMVHFGVIISSKRANIQTKIVEIAKKNAFQDIGVCLKLDEEVKRQHKSETFLYKLAAGATRDETKREICPGRRKRNKKLGDYTIEEKLRMIRRVVVDKDKHDDVAKVYGLKTASLTKLLSKMKKDKKYMTSLIEHREEDLRKRKMVLEASSKFCKDGQILVPAKRIQSQVLEDHKEKVGL